MKALKNPAIKFMIRLFIITILLAFIVNKCHAQYFDGNFIKWCELNPDTTGYEYIIAIDSFKYEAYNKVVEVKVPVKYNKFSKKYKTAESLWQYELKVSLHEYALDGKKKHPKKYLYARPIIEKRLADVESYKKYTSIKFKKLNL